MITSIIAFIISDFCFISGIIKNVIFIRKENDATNYKILIMSELLGIISYIIGIIIWQCMSPKQGVDFMELIVSIVIFILFVGIHTYIIFNSIDKLEEKINENI